MSIHCGRTLLECRRCATERNVEEASEWIDDPTSVVATGTRCPMRCRLDPRSCATPTCCSGGLGAPWIQRSDRRRVDGAQPAPPRLAVTLVGYFGLLFAVPRPRTAPGGSSGPSPCTGFLGLTLGPIVSAYLEFLPNGSQVVHHALGITAVTFVGLSGIRREESARLQLHGRLPDRRHPGCVPARAGGGAASTCRRCRWSSPACSWSRWAA